MRYLAMTPRRGPCGQLRRLFSFSPGRIAVRTLFLVLLGTPVHSIADDAPADALANTPATTEKTVAARVDGQPIYVHEIERLAVRALGEREVTPAARATLEAEALEQLVERRLILRFLERRDQAATEQDLEAEIARIERQLAQQNVTLEQYLRRTALSREDLKETLRWEKSWRGYLERHLTEENLQRFFEGRRREFDGTELRVAHILFKPSKVDDPEALSQALRQAAEVRSAIVSGEISFANAARQHSHSPTAEQGGDVGFIGRRGPMPEAFSKAAFALGDAEVSQPVVTPFGVHLIQVVEAKPGEKTWRQVRAELEQAVTRYLFTWVADQQRPHSQVEYTGTAPHFEPGTKRLAE